MKRAVFVDGSNLVYRAFYGLPASLRAASGQPVGPALALLSAYVLFAAVVAPFAGAAAVRNAQG